MSTRRAALVTIAIGAAVLAVSGLIASARVTDLEEWIFVSINGLPQGLHRFVWPVMQYGTFITIPALALVACVFRRFRLALAMLLAGIGVYLLALVVKQIVGRPRPSGLVDGVLEREVFGPESLGFPSGHAAVASALTVVVAAHLSRTWAIAALVLAAAVLFGRMYMGAHLPLDLVGGVALGAIAGGIANLLLPPRPSSSDADEVTAEARPAS